MNVENAERPAKACQICHKPMPVQTHGRPRLYCSPPCARQAEKLQLMLRNGRYWLPIYTRNAKREPRSLMGWGYLRDQVAAHIARVEGELGIEPE